jgi:zinc-binding alcohol dehydrogenase family protein
MMKAIGIKKSGPAAEVLEAFETETPVPGPHDLLVRVRGISVNPVDTKLRERADAQEDHKVLGYDASGVVVAVGSDVTLFKAGDEVWYAGDVTRPGTNSEFHLVDERITGRKPTSLDFTEAAGMPLTSITAWELLFDSLNVAEGGGEGDAILVIGGAGGVGSILIQLAKKLTKLTVIATASRGETEDWVRTMGADHVIDHHKGIASEMKALGIQPRYVAALTHTGQHLSDIHEAIAPRGHIALIDDPDGLDIMPFKLKALSVSWEFMFTRSMFGTADMIEQHTLLNRVAGMIDDGTLISTVTRRDGALTVENLAKAHEFQESGKAIGKTVLDGFAD